MIWGNYKPFWSHPFYSTNIIISTNGSHSLTKYLSRHPNLLLVSSRPNIFNVTYPRVVHPGLQEWHDKGRQFRQRYQTGPAQFTWLPHEEDQMVYPRAPHGTCKVQVVRSVSEWSHGVPKEDSIQRACLFPCYIFLL